MPDITANPNAAGPLFSQPAAEPTRVDEPKEGTLSARIVAHIRTHGPKAIFEVATAFHGEGKDHLISQRFNELVDKGLLYILSEKRKRPISERMCAVYAATSSRPPEAPKLLSQDRSPSFLHVDGKKYMRDASRDDIDVGGLAYVAAPPSQAIVYIAFCGCPRCGVGRLLFEVKGDRKIAPCTNRECGRLYRVMNLTDPEGRQHLSLVLVTL